MLKYFKWWIPVVLLVCMGVWIFIPHALVKPYQPIELRRVYFETAETESPKDRALTETQTEALKQILYSCQTGQTLYLQNQSPQTEGTSKEHYFYLYLLGTQEGKHFAIHFQPQGIWVEKEGNPFQLSLMHGDEVQKQILDVLQEHMS